MIGQQPQLALRAVQPRRGQARLAQRRPCHRQRVDRVGLAVGPGRVPAVRHQLGRHPDDRLPGRQQIRLQPPRQVPAVFHRPPPVRRRTGRPTGPGPGARPSTSTSSPAPLTAVPPHRPPPPCASACARQSPVPPWTLSPFPNRGDRDRLAGTRQSGAMPRSYQARPAGPPGPRGGTRHASHEGSDARSQPLRHQKPDPDDDATAPSGVTSPAPCAMTWTAPLGGLTRLPRPQCGPDELTRTALARRPVFRPHTAVMAETEGSVVPLAACGEAEEQRPEHPAWLRKPGWPRQWCRGVPINDRDSPLITFRSNTVGIRKLILTVTPRARPPWANRGCGR